MFPFIGDCCLNLNFLHLSFSTQYMGFSWIEDMLATVFLSKAGNQEELDWKTFDRNGNGIAEAEELKALRAHQKKNETN